MAKTSKITIELEEPYEFTLPCDFYTDDALLNPYSEVWDSIRDSLVRGKRARDHYLLNMLMDEMPADKHPRLRILVDGEPVDWKRVKDTIVGY